MTATSPALPGTIVDVTLADMGTMMGGYGGYGRGQMMGGYGGYGRGQMMGGYGGAAGPRGGWPALMTVRTSRASVPAGTVSLRVANAGAMVHELVVLPLAGDTVVGQRQIGSNGTVDETGSRGEASRTGGADKGDGILPGGVGWTTLTLKPGRYELACNLPGHYAAGMFTELDVTAA